MIETVLINLVNSNGEYIFICEEFNLHSIASWVSSEEAFWHFSKYDLHFSHLTESISIFSSIYKAVIHACILIKIFID